MKQTPTWEDFRRYLASQVVPATQWPKADAPLLNQLSTDSRNIKAGDWFVPLSGETFDGHQFIAEVLTKGAAGFFYDAGKAAGLNAAQLIKGVAVKEPLGALQAIAQG